MAGWPEGVSDGLTLRCGLCGVLPFIDYRVDDDFWNRLAPEECRLGVICLLCLEQLAIGSGLRIGGHICEVQFTGRHQTIVLRPTKVVWHGGRDGQGWKED